MTGYIIVTTITDGYGRETYQHSQIFRTRQEAEKRAEHIRPLNIWERKIERTVQECRTHFEDDGVALAPVQSVAFMTRAA